MTEVKNVPKIRFPGFIDAWEQRKVSEVADIVTGGTPRTGVEKYWTPKEIPWLSSGEVHKKYITYTDNMISVEGMNNSSAKMVKENSVLIALAGQGKTRGTVAINRIPLTTNQSIAAMTFNGEMVPEFVFCNLENRYDEIRKMSSGDGARGGLNKQLVGDIIIPFTSKQEQEKIGSFFETLDSTITLHQRKCESLKVLKKGMLQKMFPKEGKNVPEVRFPGFTDAWEQRKFSELFSERREKTKEENEDVLLSCAINGMFLNSELFGHFRGTSNIGYLKVKLNDLILSAQNLHLGNANVNLRFEHGIISPAYKVYDIIECDPLFVNAWVKKEDTKNFFLAATTEGASQCRKNIEWNALYGQTIMVPSFEEQKALGSFFKELDNTITLHQRKCDELIKCKQGLLQQMFV